MRKTPWYHQWFGTDYLELYQHRSSEEAASTVNWLLDQLQLTPPANILDIGCGSGRHSRVFARRGFQTFGLDLSWSLLLTEKVLDSQIALHRVRGDMRCLPFQANEFAIVVSLFTSFGYFQSKGEDQRVLLEISRVLNGNGFLVLDLFNHHYVKKHFSPTDETTIQGKKVTIFRWFDERNERVEKRIIIREANGIFREYQESVRLYTEEELRKMIEKAGISVRFTFGDYDGSPANGENAPRLILIGQKDG